MSLTETANQDGGAKPKPSFVHSPAMGHCDGKKEASEDSSGCCRRQVLPYEVAAFQRFKYSHDDMKNEWRGLDGR